MRDFSKVSPLIWRDKRFRSLVSSDARLAMLYFATCEHQNSAGCYRLPDAYAAADLEWEVGRYVKAREDVITAGLVLYDAETEEVFVTGWFESNGATNDKHALGCSRLILTIQSDTIREACEEAFLVSEQRRRPVRNDRGIDRLSRA